MRSALPLALRSGGFFTGRLAGAGLTFLTHVCLARWMGTANAGVYVQAFSLTLVLATLCAFGFPQAAVRVIGSAQVDADRSRMCGFVRRSRQVVLAFAVCVATIGALGSWAASRAGGEAPRWPLLLAFGSLPFFALIRLHTGLALSWSRFVLSLLPNVVVRPAVFLTAIWLVWTSGSVLTPGRAMAIHMVVLAVVLIGQTAVLERALRTELGDAQPIYETRAWLRLSAPLFLAGLYANFYPELVVVLLSLFLPPEEIAIFNAAFRTAFLLGFGISAVDSVTMPRLANLHAAGEPGSMQVILRHATLIKCGGGLAAVAGLALWGRWILGIFGEEFERGYPVLMVLALAQLARAIIGPVIELLNVTGHQDSGLLVGVVSLIATTGLLALVAPSFGILGAAYVVFAVVLLSSLWMYSRVQRYLGVNPSALCILPAR